MPAFTRRRFWRALRYRLWVTGACLAYLLTALEIPLPAAIHKDTSQPFPCQNHPCGCRTAEQCWASCCCFTPEQRWAWAREHHVEPPAYAEKPDEQPAVQGWNSVKLRDRDRGPTAKSCCRAKRETSSCCRPAERSVKSSSSKGGGFGTTTTLAVWRCQGYSTLWVSAGAVLIVPPFTASLPDCPPSSRVCLLSVHLDKVPSIPPDPPPRRPLS
jgi:hypothetical protein